MVTSYFFTFPFMTDLIKNIEQRIEFHEKNNRHVIVSELYWVLNQLKELK